MVLLGAPCALLETRGLEAALRVAITCSPPARSPASSLAGGGYGAGAGTGHWMVQAMMVPVPPPGYVVVMQPMSF